MKNGNTSRKFPNKWTLNNTILNNSRVKEEITQGIQKYYELNENKNKVCTNLQDAGKVVLRNVQL